MANSINLSLTDELRTFINNNTGDGTLYATPSEFLRQIIREKKERIEAANLRDAIVEGYQNAIAGQTSPFSGNLKDDMKKFANNNRNKK
ncbi:MAG: hypothetical protein GQ569_14510 [Methylococcaceae bacterium]|nr:hypothetical protein [Methylococcaceae bacterium]